MPLRPVRQLNSDMIEKNLQYFKFCAYGFFKNLRFFDPFLLLYFRSTGLTFFQIGILYSAREFGTLILEVPTGVISDTIGRRKTLLYSFVCYIFSFLIFYYLRSFTAFFVAMFLFSIGEAFRTGTHKAMIFDYLKMNNISDRKTEYYGHTRSWSQRGSAISSLGAGILVLVTGRYDIIFLASVIPYVLNFINLATYPAYLEGIHIQSKNKLSVSGWKDFVNMLKIAEYRKRVMNSAIFAGMLDSVQDYLQPILKTFALSLPVYFAISNDDRSTIIIAVSYFIIYLATSYASKNASLFVKKMKHISKAINYSLFGGLVLAILSGIFYEFNISIITILLFISLHLIENLRRPMNISYISESIDDRFLSTALSIESQFKTLTTAILSPIIGFLADHIGVGYAISITIALILIFYPFLKVKKD